VTWKKELYAQNGSYAAVDDRFILDSLFQEGVLNVGAGQGLAVQRPAGANLSVLVSPLDCIIKGDDVTNQGSYLGRMTEAEYVDVTAPSTTNPRIDLLVAEVIDQQYRTPTATLKEGIHLRMVAGTPAASPVVPALPATAIPLAQIAVPANALSIVAANITDVRTQAGASTLKVGTQAQPLTAAQILALTAPFDGQILYNTTQSALEAGDASTGTFASTRPLGLFFGDGSDGDVTIVGTVTLARDMNYRNLTVPSGATLITNGYRILATGVVRNAGTIHCDGGAGGDGTYSPSYPKAGYTYSSNPAVGAVPFGPGGGAGLVGRRLGGGRDGGYGSWQWYDPGNGTSYFAASAGTTVGNGLGGAGGTGANYGTANTNGNRGLGGTVSAPTGTLLFDVSSMFGLFGLVLNNSSTLVTFNGGAGGGGGGFGVSIGSNFTSQSGSGGGGGGVVVIVAEVLVNTGTISARGGKGGNGAVYGGPGGGGGGGVVALFSRRIRDTGTTLVTGGAAGAQNGAASAAVAGNPGSIYRLAV
jgi:hypothetical protein